MKSLMADRRVTRLLILASALMFFYGFILGGLQLVIAEISAEYQTNQTGMGMMVSAQYLSAVLMPVAMGGVADRIGKKPVLVAFAVVFGVGCALAGLSRSLWVYVLGALLFGAGYSVCETLCSAALADSNPAQSARYINITQCLLSVGAVVSPVITRFCMQRFGADWRIVFYICAVAFCLLALPLARTQFPTTTRHAPTVRQKSHIFFASSVFACLFASIVLYVGLENGFGYFADTLFTVKLGRPTLGAYAISAYWAGMALSRLVCGLRMSNPKRALVVCFALSAAFFAILASSQAAALSVLVCAGVGAAFGPIWSTLMSLAAQRFPQHAAGAIGIMSAGCGLGGILFPTLMGAISDHFSIGAAFWVLCATALLGLLLNVLRRRFERPAAL